MDFFNHQDRARKQTSRLIMLFVLAVVALVCAINLLVALIVWYGQGQTINSVELAARAGQPAMSFLDSLSTERILTISAAVVLVISLASLYRWLNLRGGGHVVAESLGGRRLPPNSSDFYERRLLNVVEEMAIAAGMPVPPVYVLNDDSINAFAAGYQASDAVVGVTRGCMTKLSRDQLQGVIAHEFSHIANGDMRLNIRLMALLFGILFIALIGRFVLEATVHRHAMRSNDKRNSLPLWAIGLALLVLGYVGVFFGNLIKAAVSRQRNTPATRPVSVAHSRSSDTAVAATSAARNAKRPRTCFLAAPCTSGCRCSQPIHRWNNESGASNRPGMAVIWHRKRGLRPNETIPSSLIRWLNKDRLRPTSAPGHLPKRQSL